MNKKEEIRLEIIAKAMNYTLKSGDTVDLSVLEYLNSRDLTQWIQIQEFVSQGMTLCEIKERMLMLTSDNIYYLECYTYGGDYSYKAMEDLKAYLIRLELFFNNVSLPDSIAGNVKSIKRYMDSINCVYKYVDTNVERIDTDVSQLFDCKPYKEFELYSKSLSAAFGNLRSGEVQGIVAPSGSGKSTYLVGNANKIMNSGEKVAFVYTEMTKDIILKMLFSNYIGCNINDFEKIKESKHDKIMEANELYKKKLDLFKVDEISIENLNELFNKTSADFIIIDYFEVEAVDNAWSTSNNARNVVSTLKSLCEDRNKACLFAVQSSSAVKKIAPEERDRNKVAGSRQIVHKVDQFVLMSEPVENEWSCRTGVQAAGQTKVFTILKNRFARNEQHESYENVNFYEAFNYNDNNITSLGAQRYESGKWVVEPITVDGKAYIDMSDGLVSENEEDVLNKDKVKDEALKAAEENFKKIFNNKTIMPWEWERR